MHTFTATTFLEQFWGAACPNVEFIGVREPPSAYAVTDFAAAAIAAAAAATRDLIGLLGGDGRAAITVDRSAAALWLSLIHI